AGKHHGKTGRNKIAKWMRPKGRKPVYSPAAATFAFVFADDQIPVSRRPAPVDSMDVFFLRCVGAGKQLLCRLPGAARSAHGKYPGIEPGIRAETGPYHGCIYSLFSSSAGRRGR